MEAGKPYNHNNLTQCNSDPLQISLCSLCPLWFAFKLIGNMLSGIYQRAMNCNCLSASNLIDRLVVVNNKILIFTTEGTEALRQKYQVVTGIYFTKPTGCRPFGLSRRRRDKPKKILFAGGSRYLCEPSNFALCNSEPPPNFSVLSVSSVVRL